MWNFKARTGEGRRRKSMVVNIWVVGFFENGVITCGFVSRKMLIYSILYKISVDTQTT